MRWSSSLSNAIGMSSKNTSTASMTFIAEIIAEGIAAGEFLEQDPVVASKCFGAATINLCHPQMVAQCLAKTNRAEPDDLIEFAIRALKK